MVRIALVVFSCFIAVLAIDATTARAGDYYYYGGGYYGGGYYGGSAYSHGGYENGYYGERSYGRHYRYHHGYYGDGYYGRRYSGYYGDGCYRRRYGGYYGGGYYGHGPVWYSSRCCYRRVVRHERSVYYAPAYSDYGYYRRGCYDDGPYGDYGR